MRVELRTETADDTRAVGAAFADLLRPRDAVILTGRARRRQDHAGAGDRARPGRDRPCGVADVHPRARVPRRLEVAHVDVYRLERIQDVVDLGLEDLGDGEAVLLVEWGDAVEEVLPSDHLTIELTGGERRRGARRLVLTPGGPTWIDRWERLESVAGPVERRAVIVVGIDTSTPQTSVAIGSDTEILASVSIAGRARQESVTPALEQLLRVVRAGPRSGSAASPSGSVRGCSPGCAWGWRRRRRSRRCWACRSSGITSLDALAYAVRYTSRRIAAVIDARRGEVFAAVYRAVPGGVVRETELPGHEARSPGRGAAGRARRRCCAWGTVPSCTGERSKSSGAG